MGIVEHAVEAGIARAGFGGIRVAVRGEVYDGCPGQAPPHLGFGGLGADQNWRPKPLGHPPPLGFGLRQRPERKRLAGARLRRHHGIPYHERRAKRCSLGRARGQASSGFRFAQGGERRGIPHRVAIAERRGA